MIKHIYDNFQSHNYSLHAIHDAVRKFYVQAQDPSTLVTEYLKKFQASIDVINFVGATIRVHSQLVKEEVHLILSMYATATGDVLAKLNSDCKEQSKERYLDTAYLMSPNCMIFVHILDKMENNYSRGNDQWTRILVKDRQLIVTWKSDKRRISRGLSAISYTTVDVISQKKTSEQKTASYNPNWICHLCGGKGNHHMECPKKDGWYKFRHSSHSQI